MTKQKLSPPRALRRSVWLLGQSETSVTLRQFRARAERVEVLLAGQSDIKASLDPRVFEVPTFNFADSGESFIETYYKLRRHLPEMPRLRLVILPLTFASFSTFRIDRLRPYVYRNYISVGDLPELSKLKGSRVYIEKLGGYARPIDQEHFGWFLRNIRNSFLGRPLLEGKGELIEGYRLANPRNWVNPDHAAGMIRNHLEGKDLFDPHLLSYFVRILQLCKTRAVQVVTVGCPVSDHYLEGAEKFIKWEVFERRVFGDPRIEGLIARHIDGLHLFPSDHHLFLDQTHLNAEGAARFSAYVWQEVRDLIRAGELKPDIR